jgi:hypothetical protein
MEFGPTISHPLMRVVVGVGEATIRQACGATPGLRIHVEMDQFLDGREGVRVTLKAPGALSGFFIVLRKYFDQEALARVAQHAWIRRVPCAEMERGMLDHMTRGVSLN